MKIILLEIPIQTTSIPSMSQNHDLDPTIKS